MAINKNVFLIVCFVVGLSCGGKWANAQVHHVVGDDRGWDLGTDITSWAADRVFNVGDFIWFAYSGGQDKDNLVELNNIEEFVTCDVSNPIKMYTDGVDKIHLQEEGIRYFTSSDPEICKKGLKLHVNVKPKSTADNQSLPSSSQSRKDVLAQEPTAPKPSSSTKISKSFMMIIGGLILSYVAL